MSETHIEVIHAVTGSAIMQIVIAKAVDFRSNSTFMVAVLFLVAKKLNVPRAWLVLLHPQQISLSTVRVSVVRQSPSEETMQLLCTAENNCALCGDVGDPSLFDSDGCATCRPYCICQACHVHGRRHNYCLACLPADLEQRLDVSRRTRLEALRTYWQGYEGACD